MKTLIAVLALIALSAPAHALESMWEEGARVHLVQRKCVPKRVKHHHHKPHHVAHPKADPPPRIIIKAEPVDVGAECVGRRIDVISTPHQTVDAAKDAAQTQWRAKTQFMVGGVYMDPSLSEDQKWLCSITDPRDSASSRVSETTGRLLGHSGELYRCYFSARPCRSNLEQEDDDTDDSGPR